jgi:hypothetical protein
MPSQVETIFPPDGCHLCHVKGSTGGTPNTQFGTIMVANGAMVLQTTTVTAALGRIEMTAPQLIADLRAGNDPNLDMSTGAQNLDPVPSYGCGSIARGRPAGSSDWSPVLMLVSGLAAVRRLRRGRPEGTSLASLGRGRNLPQ